MHLNAQAQRPIPAVNIEQATNKDYDFGMCRKIGLCLLFMFANYASGAPSCGGEIAISRQTCGYMVTIGDAVVGRCLDKKSHAFKTLMAKCNENQRENINLNKARSSEAELKKWMNCDGDVSIAGPTGCGYHFFVNTSEFGNGEHGTYQVPCQSESSPLVVDVRNFCKFGSPSKRDKVDSAEAVQ